MIIQTLELHVLNLKKLLPLIEVQNMHLEHFSFPQDLVPAKNTLYEIIS